jgi:hypothetical protein
MVLSAIIVDDFDSALNSTQLIDLGCKTLLCCLQYNLSVGKLRVEGYLKALRIIIFNK